LEFISFTRTTTSFKTALMRFTFQLIPQFSRHSFQFCNIGSSEVIVLVPKQITEFTARFIVTQSGDFSNEICCMLGVNVMSV